MRTLLAAALLVPAVALAQVPPQPLPQRPPFGQPGAAPRPQFGPAARPPVAPPPPGAPTGTPPPDQRPPGPVGAPAGGRSSVLRTTDAKCVPLQGRFMLSFNKADIVDVLEQASRWTCRNFVYTEDVTRGKITLLSKTPVTADEAYAAFLAALNSNNISVYATGRYYKLIRTADSKKNPIPTYTDERSGTPANEQPVTKVIRLRYVDPDQMRGIIGNFVSAQGSDVQAIPPDMLIITDIGLNIRRIEKIMGAIDRQGGGDLVRIVQIRYASARDIADKINQIFQAQGRGGTKRVIASGGTSRPPTGGPPAAVAPAGGGAVEVSVSKILPDERTNKLIVIADEKSFQRILELIEQLDVPTSTGEGGIHVVFLKNANAEDLAQTLSNLAQGQAKRAGPGGAPQPMPAAMQAGTRGAGPASAPGATAELFSGEVKITADKTQNALLIQASGSDFGAILRLIEKLDRPRRQVFVEAVIVEVNLRNDLQVGAGAHVAIPYSYKGEPGVVPIVSAPAIGQLNTTTIGTAAGLASVLQLGGFLTGFAGPVTAELKDFGIPSLGVLIQALQKSSDVNVLSTPHLVATDNEESEISVGQNVPFQAGYAPQGLQNLLAAGSTTGSTAATALATGGLQSLYAPIQRQNVELRLKIKPQINEGGAVRLTIDEQTEEIAGAPDPQLGPTTSKRSVKTMVVAKDQSTIVLGGLIQERSLRSVNKIPLLGSIPIIGWLFRNTTTTKQKTNLLLFLTPYIIRNEEDYRRIFEKKRKEQQEFTEQFYGRQPEYEIEVDFTRKAGPYARMRAGVAEETSRLENGGAGGPGERVTYPPGEGPPSPSPATPEARPPEGAPEEGEDGTPVDRLDVQPNVPAPGAPAPGEGAPADAQPPAAAPPATGAPATPPETEPRPPPPGAPPPQ